MVLLRFKSMVFKGDLSAQSHLFFQPQSAAGVQVWDRWKLDLTSVGASLGPQVGREEGQGGRCSVAQSCPTLYDLMDCSTPGLPVITNSCYLLTLIESVMPSNHLILCRPLLLLPSIFLSIRVFSNVSVLCIRWPKYWSFSLFPYCPGNHIR